MNFEYKFEELPLVISNGIEAGLVDGMAIIKYYADGEWDIEDVFLEGYKRISEAEREAGKNSWVFVEVPNEIATIIVGRLLNEWNSRVSGTVQEQLQIDRECAADDYADMKRDRMMMGED